MAVYFSKSKQWKLWIVHVIKLQFNQSNSATIILDRTNNKSILNKIIFKITVETHNSVAASRELKKK